MKQIFYILILLISNYSTVYSQEKISIKTNPSKTLIEVGENNQFLNCDFLIQNNTDDTLEFSKIVATVFDDNKIVLHQRFLDNNGTAPSIRIIPDRIFNGKSSILVFNPFTEFNSVLSIKNIEFEFTFSNDVKDDVSFKTVVHPEKYEQNEKFIFPLKGTILNYDGHDYFAHHRRFNYEFEPIKQLGISTNFMRYAYDFVMLGKDNKQFIGSGANDEDYYGYNMNVYAVADGTVIYDSNDHKDDKKFDVTKLKDNPLELYGNCIGIQHKNGSISIYGHLKQNSIKVKKGDVVKSGQKIANIGVSGSSFFPHLHFEVRTALTNNAEGRPSYFSNVYSIENNNKLSSGLVETGNIIIAK